MYPDRRLKIAQIVFETTINDFVIPVSLLGITVPGILADAVQAEDLHPVVELTIMSHDHTTLSRREVFGRVKAETNGVALITLFGVTGPNRMPLVVSTDCMRSIFDDKQSFLARKAPDRIHITRQPRDMHGYYRACSIGHFPGD